MVDKEISLLYILKGGGGQKGRVTVKKNGRYLRIGTADLLQRGEREELPQKPLQQGKTKAFLESSPLSD